MSISLPGHEAAKTLRDRILDSYISSNAGPHQPLDEVALKSYCRAYRYHLRGWMPTPTGASWLDLGCGQGALMHLATSFGYDNVTGVDISEEMLAACRASGLSVESADVWEYLMAAPSGQWDVVSAFDLLEHFPKEEGYRLLQEIKRVLAPGGMCLLKLPNATSPWGSGVTASDLTHEASYTPYSLIQLAKLAGFHSSQVREVGPAPGSLASRVRGVLWRGLRLAYRAMNVVETGSSGRGIYTQVMLARLHA